MFLIEQLPTETPNEVQAFLDSILQELYGQRPHWLVYEWFGSYRYRGQQFVEMRCVAGSVHLRLSLRATTGSGISRDIIQAGTRTGQPFALLVCKGLESVVASEEIERIG